jgi:hypothetical protein
MNEYTLHRATVSQEECVCQDGYFNRTNGILECKYDGSRTVEYGDDAHILTCLACPPCALCLINDRVLPRRGYWMWPPSTPQYELHQSELGQSEGCTDDCLDNHEQTALDRGRFINEPASIVAHPAPEKYGRQVFLCDHIGCDCEQKHLTTAARLKLTHDDHIILNETRAEGANNPVSGGGSCLSVSPLVHSLTNMSAFPFSSSS